MFRKWRRNAVSNHPKEKKNLGQKRTPEKNHYCLPTSFHLLGWKGEVGGGCSVTAAGGLWLSAFPPDASVCRSRWQVLRAPDQGTEGSEHSQKAGPTLRDQVKMALTEMVSQPALIVHRVWVRISAGFSEKEGECPGFGGLAWLASE